MKNASDKSCRENQIQYFFFSKMELFMKFCKKCAVTIKAIDDHIIRLMHFESWITKVTQTRNV